MALKVGVKEIAAGVYHKSRPFQYDLDQLYPQQTGFAIPSAAFKTESNIIGFRIIAGQGRAVGIDRQAEPGIHLGRLRVPQLLEILVCPACKADLDLVPLAEGTRSMLVDRYREKFRDEEPVVTDGLYCASCGRVYPIVSDIPVMLVDEALPAGARAS